MSELTPMNDYEPLHKRAPAILLMENHPFISVRAHLTDRLSRSLDEVEYVTMRQETRELPMKPGDQWVTRTPTGEKSLDVHFRDGQTCRFEWKDNGPVEVKA